MLSVLKLCNYLKFVCNVRGFCETSAKLEPLNVSIMIMNNEMWYERTLQVCHDIESPGNLILRVLVLFSVILLFI